MRKNLITIFDRAKNFHLVKDVGQVPFHLHKEYGYNATLVTCKNEDYYPYLDKEVQGLKMQFIPNFKIFKINLGVVFYLMKNAKNIDVLQQFHIRNYTLLYAIIYKIFNKDGINYIKADANEKYLLERGRILKKKYLNIIDKYIDYLSFETSRIVELFKDENSSLSKKVLKVPNGIDEKYVQNLKLNDKGLGCSKKENSIIHVARVGDYVKNTELFLNAIEKVHLENWKVNIIGEIDIEFKSFIETFFIRNKHLINKVIFHGNITSREELYEYYARSKIFCLTSRYEGFPLVYPEAIYFGNYIVTTDVSGANDITDNERLGVIVKNVTAEAYADTIEKLIHSSKLDYEICEQIKKFATKNFTWQSIVYTLHNKLMEKL